LSSCFRWWPKVDGERAEVLVAHQLQVLLSAGDPANSSEISLTVACSLRLRRDHAAMV